MSRSVSQVIIALACVAGTPVLYFITFVLLERSWLRADEDALLASTIITGAALITAWIAIWRKTVQWTVVRRILTALAVLWSAGAATLISLIVIALLNPRDAGMAIALAGAVWVPMWLVSTALIWRETGFERALRIDPRAAGMLACPNCGYDLRGLSEARCPECGRRYTLDQIVNLALGIDDLADILHAQADHPPRPETVITFTAPGETK